MEIVCRRPVSASAPVPPFDDRVQPTRSVIDKLAGDDDEVLL
jgi:hypothetical protein